MDGGGEGGRDGRTGGPVPLEKAEGPQMPQMPGKPEERAGAVRPPQERPDRSAVAVLVGLLVLGNALTGWLLLRSFLASPSDGWDQGSVTAAGVPAMWAHVLSWLTEWGTWQLVGAGRLRMWWMVPPVLVMAVSLVRMLYVTQQP
ncbi:hypothetical protein GT204_15905 [Streptomyces sp. SID4919]|uniref:hypothetical protein n=1 Tax=unclassified Streptomyces TaxID=2593676 RepID=UPI000823B030|nr:MULTISPECIES: hypothetical protein [unclassified Streptomyces]MYY10348.1 hypothetical protein [Streptomyces sp. SID4919]SCK63370.1 hypothetical protein YW7DRAFT_07126 [Streptomyces sp. AmelKG-E11A]